MRYHLLKKYLLCPLLCLGLFSLDGIAFAQVYKSYDADGNVVFSDKPTEGGQEVEVTEPNLSDSFEIPPPPAEPLPDTNPEAESEPEPAAPPIADDNSADTNKDGRISKREREEERKERPRKKREKKKAAEGDEE